MIKDQSGRVFVRYHQPVPKQIQVGSMVYVTDVRHGVAMLLVQEQEVAPLLAHLGGCCGEQKRVFSLPNQESVNVYLTGER